MSERMAGRGFIIIALLAAIAVGCSADPAGGPLRNWAFGTPPSHGFLQRNTATCAPVQVYDGFEDRGLSNLWQALLLSPGVLTLQSIISRAGHGAAKITLHADDRFGAGINGSSNSERDELLEARSLAAQTMDHCTYQYSFSLLLPNDFPIVSSRLVIAQWKQYCPDQQQSLLTDGTIAAKNDRPCSDDSPVLAIRFMSNTLRVTQDIEKKHTVLSERKGAFLNRWLDFKFDVRFSPGADGRIQTWLDDRELVNYTGTTANPENGITGYSAPSRYYFKVGLYRNVMTEPMTMYVDEYRKKSLP